MSKIIRLSIIALLLVILGGSGGCATKKIEVLTTPIERAPLNLPFPSVLHITPLEWYVITPDNIVEQLERLKEHKKNIVFFAIPADDYESLVKDVEQLQNYISQYNMLLHEYKRYYESKQ